RILLTASNEIGTAIQTVNSGLVYRFISKPWDNDELNKIVDGAIAFYDMVSESKKLTGLTKCRTNS
ncbi:MAG: two-component system response regulator, partial [Planctomycetes bacterium]|nr:two-component system response regulator [Planctomycetota bacterium]